MHLTQIAGEKMQKVDLCEECAKQKGVNDPAGFSLADLLLGLGASQELEQVPGGAELKCPRCGFTQADFKKAGRLGCADCYTTFSEGLEGLYGALLQELEREQVLTCLDEIIRIRALQDFAPSQALAFIFLLKNVIRQELAEEIQKENLAAEILDLESRIDGLALLGFDIYTKRREKIYEIKADEAKRRVSGLMRKSGLSDDSL